MDKNRVREALQTLQAELADADRLDEASRASLKKIADDVERQLAAAESSAGDDDDALPERLQDALLEFEAEHPKVTAAINQVAAALANLGI